MKGMRMDRAVMTAIACLAVISLSTFALLHMQAVESISTQNEKNNTDANGITVNPANRQPFRSDIKQTLSSDVPENKVDEHREQEEQMLNNNAPATQTAQTNENQVSQPLVPFPDGRIFSQAGGGTEDAIPYIPTEYPKTAVTTPLVPLEPDY